jgi:hypothetical protein
MTPSLCLIVNNIIKIFSLSFTYLSRVKTGKRRRNITAFHMVIQGIDSVRVFRVAIYRGRKRNRRKNAKKIRTTDLSVALMRSMSSSIFVVLVDNLNNADCQFVAGDAEHALSAFPVPGSVGRPARNPHLPLTLP